MSSSEAAAIIRFEGAVPQFTVPDVVRTAEYYRDVLGFHIAGYWGTPPVFAIVRRDQVEMFFNRADQSEIRTGRASDRTIGNRFRASVLESRRFGSILDSSTACST